MHGADGLPSQSWGYNSTSAKTETLLLVIPNAFHLGGFDFETCMYTDFFYFTYSLVTRPHISTCSHVGRHSVMVHHPVRALPRREGRTPEGIASLVLLPTSGVLSREVHSGRWLSRHSAHTHARPRVLTSNC